MKLYLDTSVVSAFYDERTPERQASTISFWKDTIPKHELYVSDVTIKELKNTTNKDLRLKFQKLIKGMKILKSNKRAKELAKIYVRDKIFPENYFDDALHVAIASSNSMDLLVSWNFTHMVKVETRKLVRSENVLHHFKEIEIVSPLEI